VFYTLRKKGLSVKYRNNYKQLKTKVMSKTGWIILASIVVVGAGIGTYFIIKSKKSDEEAK
jgi:CTP-dependent riboflavin kinase